MSDVTAGSVSATERGQPAAAAPPHGPHAGSGRRSRGRRFLSAWGPPAVAFAAGLALWQLFVSLDLGRMQMPGVGELASAIVTFGTSGEFWSAAADSARVFVQGLVPATVVGVLLGLVIGNVRWLNNALGPLFFAIYTTPFIALIPLLLVLFGFGIIGKTMIVFFLVLITVVLQTIAGVRNIDTVYWEVSDSFRAPLLRRWFEVALPAALPFVIAGVRLGIGRALVGVVVAEFETAITGLGGIIIFRAQRLELAEASVPAIFLAIVGILFTAVLRRWEQRLTLWKT